MSRKPRKAVAKKKKKEPWKPNDTPARWKQLYKAFGITRDQYQNMLLEQGGSCYICLKSPQETKPRRNLAVDHCHRSGKIRGLLCYLCNNRLLGWYIRDDHKKASRIVTYLTREVNYGKVPEKNDT